MFLSLSLSLSTHTTLGLAMILPMCLQPMHLALSLSILTILSASLGKLFLTLRTTLHLNHLNGTRARFLAKMQIMFQSTRSLGSRLRKSFTQPPLDLSKHCLCPCQPHAGPQRRRERVS
ncbi:hypothetical protein BKA57DRAFT_463898 [Linnemannia elongata]|nr:hypothetical protein BKA57DRAFT_463898 [Linnemannia elongata]